MNSSLTQDLSDPVVASSSKGKPSFSLVLENISIGPSSWQDIELTTPEAPGPLTPLGGSMSFDYEASETSSERSGLLISYAGNRLPSAHSNENSVRIQTTGSGTTESSTYSYTKNEPDRLFVSEKHQFRDNAVLGSDSFFTFLNTGDLNQGSSNPRNGIHKYLHPRDRVLDNNDYLNISPHLVPGFTLTRQMHPINEEYELIYHGFKNDDDSCNDVLPALTPVIIRLSHSVSRTHSLARFLNEWYILSGLCEPSSYRFYSNPALQNKYSKSLAVQDLSQPVTLPRDLDGVLYPLASLSFSMEDFPGDSQPREMDHEQRDSMDEIPKDSADPLTTVVPTTLQKRFAMVFPNNKYQPLKIFSDKNVLSLSEQHNTDLDIFDRKSESTPTALEADRNSASLNSLGFRQGSSNLATFSFQSQLAGASSTASNALHHAPQHRLLCPLPIKALEILHDMFKVCETLGIIHELGIVHNGINSANILKSESDPSDIKMAGWDFCFTNLPEDTSHAYRRRNLLTVLPLVPYMSPEQCREDSKGIDYRADFYLFGIVLYELLVGYLPFRDRNAAKIARMHIVQQPVIPAIASPDSVSPEMSRIIMKLLEKLPARRYQDAYTLLHDLANVRNAYIEDFAEKHPQLYAFYMKQPDASLYVKCFDAPYPEKCGIPPVFLKPRGVFGRDALYRDANAAYNSMGDGMGFILVLGDSGNGVLTLLNGMRSISISKQRLLMSWKFNPSALQISIYSACIHGISMILQQIKLMPSHSISQWRERLRTHLPAETHIILPFIPELDLLMGDSHFRTFYKPSERAESHVNTELKIRFVIKTLISIFASEGLTIYMEDVQWCLPAEWSFFTEIFEYIGSNELDQPYTFKIVAGYSTGLPADLPIEQVENVIESVGFDAHRFNLGPMSREAYADYLHALVLVGTQFNDRKSVMDMHDLPVEHDAGEKLILDDEVVKLANNLYDITNGSILDTRLFFATAGLSGKLGFDARPTHMRWNITYDATAFENKDLLRHYATSVLSPDAQLLLKFAALSSRGSYFHLSDLLIVLNWPLEKVYRILHNCTECRVIVPTSTFSKIPFHLVMLDKFPFELSENDVWSLVMSTRYRFQHDVMHTSIVESMEENNELGLLNRLCGLRYYKRFKDDESNASDYQQMANHLEKSWQQAKPDEHAIYRRVLIQAGQLALTSYNLRASLKFFQTADRFIGEKDLKTKIKSILTICQNYFHLREYNKCLACMDEACAKYGFDETIFILFRVRCYILLGDIENGFAIGLSGLEKLGFKVPKDLAKLKHAFTSNLAKIPLSIVEIRGLNLSERATHPLILLIYELILEIVGASYETRYYNLRRFLVTKVVMLMHKYGSSPYCSISLVEFANILAMDSDYEALNQSKEFCKLAVSLLQLADSLSSLYVQKVYKLYIASLAIFVHPINTVIDYNDVYNDTLYDSGVDTLLLASAHARATKLKLLILKSQPLESAMKHYSGKSWTISQLRKSPSMQLCGLALLRGEISLDELDSMLTPRLFASKQVAFEYRVAKVYYLVAHDRFEEAKHFIFEASIIRPDLANVLVLVEFYTVAVHVFVMCDLNFDEKVKCDALFERILKIYERWLSALPEVFASKYAYIRATHMAYTNKCSSLQVLDAFEEAIDGSRESNQWYDYGYFSLTCFRWLIHRNLSKKRAAQFARMCSQALKGLDSKLFAVLDKGCISKNLTEENWAGVMVQDVADDLNIATISPLGSTVHRGSTPISGRASSSDFMTQKRQVDDWNAVNTKLNQAVKACLMMTDSADDDTLAVQLLESTLLFSGADRGVVVVMNDEELFIKAVGASDFVDQLSQPLGYRTDLAPFALITHLVYSGDIVDKSDDRIYFENRFGGDNYFRENDCSSLICIPLQGQSSSFGALYLECRSRKSGKGPFFDSDKKALLDLLCTQATVLLSKSRLYKQMELAKKAAEDATAEKASFLANMSHEIRTPFNSLLLCAIFLLDTDLNETQREYVETIKGLAMVTLNIIDGILAFSKIEHGSFTLANSPFDLNECIESSLQLSGEQAAMNDLEFVFHNKCLDVDTIEGDITRFRQVVINMVGNALKFTSKGLVIVELDSKELSIDRNETTITVRDSGIGIAEDAKGKVFGAFSQVDGSARRQYGGSGLGLAISKKLAGIMGGLLNFTSEEGVGSTFVFTVNSPVKKRTKPLFLLDAATAKETGRTNNALIVNSHIALRQSLTCTLEFLGLDVVQLSLLGELRCNIDDFSFIFVCHHLYANFKKYIKLLRPGCRLVVLTPFGRSLTSEFKDATLLHCPFQRSKVISLLEYQDKTDEAQPQKKPAVEKLLSEKYPLNILLAEDNLINTRVALQHLKRLGYRAAHAKDGDEVLVMCKKLLDSDEPMYDVILMDIQMPRKDGIAATIEVKELFATKGIGHMTPLVVALTANVAGDDRKRSLECGMVDFISKPLIPSELHRVLSDVGEAKYRIE